MLSKEEIERIKINLKNKTIEKQEDFKNIVTYINHLESDKQKLIEKLARDKIELTEELKYNSTKREARMQLNSVNKYLEIVKGE